MKKSKVIREYLFVGVSLFLFFLLCVCIYTYIKSLRDMSPTYHIVVAKYKEDISWLSHMDQSKLHVYDKSGDENSPYIKLQNKGREGTTFLGHIIYHYDNLPDYVIILQGNPFAHMNSDITPENLQENIDNLVKSRPTDTQPLLCDWYREQIDSFPGIMMDKYHRFIFEGEPDMTLYFAAGNQYILPRKQIQNRPKAFYSKLWKMAIKGDHYDVSIVNFGDNEFDPTEVIGWSLERLFPTIMKNVPMNKTFLES